MAIYVRRFVLRRILKSVNCFNKYDKRLLLSEADLKMDRYLRQRIFKIDELGVSGKDITLKKLESVSSPSEAKCSLYAFIDLIHIAESRDLPILKAVMQLICKSDVDNIDNFNFGASFLRLCYHLGLPTEAYNTYKDPVFHNILNDNTCHKILMDMLYNCKDYHKVLDVFKGLKRFNIDCITLALAAYYHLDTEESFNAAYTLIYKLWDNNHLTRRSLLFYSMQCINQNKPKEALKALEVCKGNNLTLNVQLIALAQLGETSKIMSIMEQVKKDSENIYAPLMNRIYSDTMVGVEHILKKELSQKDFADFCCLKEDLSDRAVLSQQTLKNLLERTIPGDVSHRKQSGKEKVIRGFSALNTYIS